MLKLASKRVVFAASDIKDNIFKSKNFFIRDRTICDYFFELKKIVE